VYVWNLAATQPDGLEVELECQTEESMTRKFKPYEPIGFGDRPDLETLEGHRNAEAEAAETPDTTEGWRSFLPRIKRSGLSCCTE
jgi:hypothetical protein